MYVCLCRGVNEETVRNTIAAGAHDPISVSRCSGAGTGCGGCFPELCRLLEECGIAAGACEDDTRHTAA
ncbi:MAG TPA: (2Fe-2S)-binding protein [Acidimicrobiales bacterium]|nr:(2Fe-2S)-binding protein [Acidimicrobiales bacterium]